mmetsp:Transcript_34991/g.91895  ORF Transcript_34991/g.91895 Transcript_34991/m.91895 type:complete len:328 (-) Transcript_34991:824-1807(-)
MATACDCDRGEGVGNRGAGSEQGDAHDCVRDADVLAELGDHPHHEVRQEHDPQDAVEERDSPPLFEHLPPAVRDGKVEGKREREADDPEELLHGGLGDLEGVEGLVVLLLLLLLGLLLLLLRLLLAGRLHLVGGKQVPQPDEAQEAGAAHEAEHAERARGGDADALLADDAEDELDDDQKDERAVEAVERLAPVAEEAVRVPLDEHLLDEEEVEGEVEPAVDGLAEDGLALALAAHARQVLVALRVVHELEDDHRGVGEDGCVEDNSEDVATENADHLLLQGVAWFVGGADTARHPRLELLVVVHDGDVESVEEEEDDRLPEPDLRV